MLVPNFVTDLLGARVKAKARGMWNIHGRDMADCEGRVTAVAFETGWAFLVMDASNMLHMVHPHTHDIEVVSLGGVVGAVPHSEQR